MCCITIFVCTLMICHLFFVYSNTHEQYPMPDTPIDGISYDDTVKQFVDISMSVGSKVVMAKPGEKLDDIVRSAYPEAKTIASNIAETSSTVPRPSGVRTVLPTMGMMLFRYS